MLAHYVIIYLAGEIESIYQAANKWMARRIHSISIPWPGAKLLNNFSNLKLITIFSRPFSQVPPNRFHFACL